MSCPNRTQRNLNSLEVRKKCLRQKVFEMRLLPHLSYSNMFTHFFETVKRRGVKLDLVLLMICTFPIQFPFDRVLRGNALKTTLNNSIVILFVTFPG